MRLTSLRSLSCSLLVAAEGPCTVFTLLGLVFSSFRWSGLLSDCDLVNIELAAGIPLLSSFSFLEQKNLIIGKSIYLLFLAARAAQ